MCVSCTQRKGVSPGPNLTLWNEMNLPLSRSTHRLLPDTYMNHSGTTRNAKTNLQRDVLKSNTARVDIPELELTMLMGTLGGIYTTVEGLVSAGSTSDRVSDFKVTKEPALAFACTLTYGRHANTPRNINMYIHMCVCVCVCNTCIIYTLYTALADPRQFDARQSVCNRGFRTFLSEEQIHAIP